MGLGALTQDQMINLLLWVDGQKQAAKDSVVQTTWTCGRPGESSVTPEAYDKVRVYVTASGDADEIISGIRERFRTMNGTEVVYSSAEADLTISLLGMKTKTQNGRYQLGYATSVVVAKPCVWKWGTYTEQEDAQQNHFLQVGSDSSSVINAVVSLIDTDDLEKQRSSNASLKKYLLGAKG
jgi:hypothetical protein